MSEFGAPERQHFRDYNDLKQSLFRWKMYSDSPGLAELIMDDITPQPEDDMTFSQLRMNAARRARLAMLTRDEYMTSRLESDDVVRGLSEAISIVDDDSIQREALVTLLQVYRIQKNIAPKKSDVIDPRRIAFRLLNPAVDRNLRNI